MQACQQGTQAAGNSNRYNFVHRPRADNIGGTASCAVAGWTVSGVGVGCVLGDWVGSVHLAVDVACCLYGSFCCHCAVYVAL